MIEAISTAKDHINLETYIFDQDELGILFADIFGEEFANAMENTFIEDLRYSVKIARGKWEQRALGERLKEWIVRSLEYWL